MCEVRRVFHNVNSDPKKIVPVFSTKKTIINKKLQNEEQISGSIKENRIINTEETSQGKHAEKYQPNKFSEPKLLTSLKIIDSLKNIGNERKFKNLGKPNIPTEANSIKQRVPNKVNIPFEEKVYKGLIELQVTDEDLGLNTNIPLKRKEFIRNKEPEPVLSDFYKPKFDREYIIKPSVPKFEINPVFITDIPSILAATKKWEPIEDN